MGIKGDQPESFKELVGTLAKLPGVGPKTAQRYAFYLLHVNRDTAMNLSESIVDALRKISNCERCNTLCEGVQCNICKNTERDHSKLCIVESPSDLFMVEQSHAFNGLYFVLMGKVSFIEGIGPNELGFKKLLSRAAEEDVEEIIVATNFTAEGEATAQAIESSFKEHSTTKNKKLARLARGVPYGAELEYTDLGTIAQAFRERREES
tara:strand:+ start:4146 stop:4769 length:624 start_codon:yes stop_codon:yes gene_type:complete